MLHFQPTTSTSHHEPDSITSSAYTFVLAPLLYLGLEQILFASFEVLLPQTNHAALGDEFFYPWLEVLQLLCLQVLAKFLCVPRTETCSCGSQISQIYFDSESSASLWYKELGSLSFLNIPKSHSSVAVAFLQHFTFCLLLDFFARAKWCRGARGV